MYLPCTGKAGIKEYYENANRPCPFIDEQLDEIGKIPVTQSSEEILAILENLRHLIIPEDF
jgi:hypothetical protein